MGILIYLIIALFVCIAVLGFLLFRMHAFFRVLSKDVKGQNLIDLLEQIIKRIDKSESRLSELSKQLSLVKSDQRKCLQRVGYIRFNPFNDMGGDQSFCLTLLNGELDGIIITSLHSRNMTRIYLKPVKDGKSNFILSKEEKKSLEIAIGLQRNKKM
ncbi:MAG: DUF4446 family protein [Patescibacteria group bacterium]|nr:DUF4446 family protein [Patescibacteria group bacterium]